MVAGTLLAASPVIIGWSTPVRVTVTVGTVAYSAIACSVQQVQPFFWLSWPVRNVSAPISTADFGVTVHEPSGRSVAPNTTAPPPVTGSPCNTGVLSGIDWFAILLDTSKNPVATFPATNDTWDTGATANVPLIPGCWITILFGGDITGTNDTLAGFGVAGSVVTIAGLTSVGPYHAP